MNIYCQGTEGNKNLYPDAFIQCLVVDIHNESVNIHTHLWAALLFGYFLFDFYEHINQYPTATVYDAAGFIIFLLSAIVCLTFSAGYHTMSCHSKIVHDFCHTFDYAGIVILTVGSFFPSVYYAFYCEPGFQAIYLTGLSVAGIAASYFVLSPEYSRPSHRGARTTVFVSLGLCGVVPICHAMSTFGIRRLCHELGFIWVLVSGASYIIGALIYANRIPEKWFTGSSDRFFDTWFSSHQIFHVHVVLAALAHYVSIRQALHHWHTASSGGCLID